MNPSVATEPLTFKVRRENDHDRGQKKQSSDNKKHLFDFDDTSQNSNSDKNQDGKNSNSNDGGNNGNNNGNNKFSFPGQNGNGGNNGQGGGSNSNSNSGIKFFPPGNCQFVNENDGRLHYSGTWTLESKDPTGLRTTTHTTTEAGSQMSVSFNGL